VVGLAHNIVPDRDDERRRAISDHFVGIAEAVGVTRHAVHKWRSRNPSGPGHPFPEPDVEIDGTPGWRPERLEEIVRWRDGLPGRGAGGGRPTAAKQEYLAAAAARGLDRQEAMRALATFAEEFPHMTRPELYAWIIESSTDTASDARSLRMRSGVSAGWRPDSYQLVRTFGPGDERERLAEVVGGCPASRGT
jgi:hypothetical protein